MKAAQLGISDSVSGYIGQLDAATNKTHGFNLATMGARRELLVLAHEASQGNWTKFGGSLGVLAERTDALSAILSAAGLGVGLFAAAVTFVGYEIYKTVTAIDSLNKSSVATNGYLGLTKDQLTAMAEGLSSANGGLVEVSATMATLIGSGRVSADTLAELTGVVTQFGKDTGLTAEKAAEAFVKMIEDPKKGIDELQSKYHTFSAAQIEVIEGYIKTGDTAQATKAFIDAVAESQSRMAKEGTQEVGLLTRIWQSFADAAKQAGDNFDRMGVAASNTQKLTDATQRQAAAARNLAQAKAMPFGNVSSAQQEMDAANAQVAGLQKVHAAQQKAADDNKQRAKGGDAQIALNNYLNDSSHAGPGKQRDIEIAAENAKFAKLKDVVDKGSKEYQQALKDHYEAIDTINAQYAKKTKPHATYTNQGGINAAIAQTNADNASLESQRKLALSQAKADYDTGNKSYEQYYAQVHDTNTKILNEELANAEKRAQLAAGKKEQTALISAQKEIQRITDERTKSDQAYTDAIALHAEKRADNVAKFAAQQASIQAKQQHGFDSKNATQFMTPLQASTYTAQQQLYETYLQNVKALNDKYEFTPNADKLQQAQELQNLQESYTKQQAALAGQLAEEQSVRDSYSNQIQLSLTKIAGDGQTNAQLVGDAFTSVWQTSANALEQFVTTGKGNFSQFASSVIADMAKIALQAAETQIFSSILGSFGGGNAGGVANGVTSFAGAFHLAGGGGVSGSGTSTSDSIPAMLSNGEYVINAASTKKYSGLLAAINSGNLGHFASGGAVGTVASSSTSAASGNSPVSVTVNNNGGNGLSDSDAADLHATVQAFVDKRMAQKMRGQGGYAYQMKYGQI
jgi:lambda family phage tail tape measure protein